MEGKYLDYQIILTCLQYKTLGGEQTNNLKEKKHLDYSKHFNKLTNENFEGHPSRVLGGVSSLGAELAGQTNSLINK